MTIKYIDIAEFRRLGYLQEVNRLFFHPRGLALEVHLAEDGTETLSGVWDYREDPEGIVYGDGENGPDDELAVEPRAEYIRHREARIALFGQPVQPLRSEL